MRKTITTLSALFCCAAVFGSFSASAAAVPSLSGPAAVSRAEYSENEEFITPPAVSAAAAVVIDAKSGLVLYNKNGGKRLSMASTTKIMTTIISLESEHLFSEIKVTKEMVTVEGTSMGLKPGDSVSLHELCCGMMMCSGNDAANAAAIFIGGSVSGFAKIMNRKAAEIGMKSTVFVTPSGLDNENHLSTAADMAVLAAYAMKNPDFARLVCSESIKTSFGNPPYERTLYNHNRFLQMYDGACGIKTGFTKKSGRCLVTAVRREDSLLVAVTLKAPDDWDDHVKLYDYGFSKMKKAVLSCSLQNTTLPVTGDLKSSVGVSSLPVTAYIPYGSEQKIKWHIEAYPFASAPVTKGSALGSVVYSLNGGEIARSPLLADRSIAAVQPDETFLDDLLSQIKNIFNGIFF